MTMRTIKNELRIYVVMLVMCLCTICYCHYDTSAQVEVYNSKVEVITTKLEGVVSRQELLEHSMRATYEDGR